VDDTPGLARDLKTRWRHGPGDRGADVVFQCRGTAAALATALRCLRPQGTVVDLAFYVGGTDDVRLGEEFHHNGLSLVCAQIGRVPRGLAHLWDRRRLSTETLDLLADHGQLVRDVLITDVVPLQLAPQVFAELSARRRHALTVVFEGSAR
jgi:threonine dehydrogenase-like Zn-dependent dehydrogenase